MPSVQRFSELLSDLQQIERGRSDGSLLAHGDVILSAFTRHTTFDAGAVWLRDMREGPMRLVASTPRYAAPEVIEAELPGDVVVAPDVRRALLGVELEPHVLVPLRSAREQLGLLALFRDDHVETTDDELELLRGAATFLSALMTN